MSRIGGSKGFIQHHLAHMSRYRQRAANTTNSTPNKVEGYTRSRFAFHNCPTAGHSAPSLITQRHCLCRVPGLKPHAPTSAMMVSIECSSKPRRPSYRPQCPHCGQNGSPRRTHYNRHHWNNRATRIAPGLRLHSSLAKHSSKSCGNRNVARHTVKPQ